MYSTTTRDAEMAKIQAIEDILRNMDEDTVVSIYNNFAMANSYETLFGDLEAYFHGVSFYDAFNRLADPGDFSLNADYFMEDCSGLKSYNTAADVIEELVDWEDLARHLMNYGDEGFNLAGESAQFKDAFLEYLGDYLEGTALQDADLDGYVYARCIEDILMDDWDDLAKEIIEEYREDRESLHELIPTWAMGYLINGDATGLSDEDLKTVTYWEYETGYSVVCPKDNEEPHFTTVPAFGKPCDCYLCEVIINND